MSKRAVYDEEHAKLTEIFADVEESKRKLVEGLIDDAAFLKSENHALKTVLKETGMVNFHPENKNLSKSNEAAKQYLKNVNSYSVIVKALNSVLNANIIDEDEDGLGDFA